MSTIKFGTDGWRAVIGDMYTLDNLARVTEGMVSWLKRNYDKPSVMLGYDCRFNGELFSRFTANYLASKGIQVFISPSFASTPMVSLATNKRQCSAGIVITASHNPPEYSGFKIKGDYGGPAYPSIITDVENAIPDHVDRPEDKFDEYVDQKLIQYYDMEAVYINHLKENFDLHGIRESGVKIGYDAMYGAGQAVFPKIFPKAYLLHADYNPSFMGTAPEPIEKNLGEFQEFIRANDISIGLATDGDADRIGLFDENGNFVDSHHIILLLIHYLHKYKGMSGKVVFTFSGSQKISKLCELYGLPFEITKIGFKYICEIMLNEDVLVGGEESGGIAIAGHVPERDGIYIGITIMEMMAHTGKSLTELIDEIYEIVGPFNCNRNDLHITEALKKSIIENCREGKYTNFGGFEVSRVETTDGYRFYFPEEQSVMIRPSGTEPVLRIYAESASREKTSEILDATVKTILDN